MAVQGRSWLDEASDKGYVPGLRNAEGLLVVAQPRAGLTRRFGIGGISVNMLNDNPGVWYDDNGRELSAEVAAAAGYDTEKLLKERDRLMALSVAQREIDRQFEVERERKVIKFRGGYRVVDLGLGNYNVEDMEGFVFNAQGPLSEQVAMTLFDKLAPPKEKGKPAAE